TRFDGRLDGRRGRLDVVVIIVTDDRNVTGQLGNRDGVVVAASTAPPPGSRRGTNRPVPGQQFGHRDRPGLGAFRLGVWSGHDLSPLDRLAAFRSTPRPPAPRTAVSTRAVPSASLSSFRKMSPSRNAHGQMSTVSIDSARILAPAPSAPATICGAR